jgi:4-aminobutyrate aminotransferase-like enzyme
MLPELITSVPGPKSKEWATRLRACESRNVTFLSEDFPIFWKKAHGTNVWDVDGNRFIDLTSGFGVAGLGYTPEPVVAAMQEQAGELYHAMGDVHPTAEKVELCETLSRLTFENWNAGSGKSLLTNSGSEAVEAALKTAFMVTRKPGVLAFNGSYHGLGYGAVTATENLFFRGPFSPQLANWAVFAPYPWELRPNDFSAAEEEARLREKLTRHPIGAILVEPIQGRGGEVVPLGWFLPLLRRLADEFKAVLIFDEVFTGFYRTGKRFACDHWNVVPDIICLGKALTSGFPLAACVGKAAIMDAWPPSDGEAIHTSTFLGNPLGCRMALTALAEMERRDLETRVNAVSEKLCAAIDHLRAKGKPWGQRRGRGLILGLEVVNAAGKPDPAKAGQFIEQMLVRGVIILSGSPQRNVLSFTPAFDLSAEEIDFALMQLANAATT